MSRSREIALGERDAIVSFLRRKAADCRRMARNQPAPVDLASLHQVEGLPLADSMQNRPEADRWEERAKVCEETAEQINQEAHWK
jgi:hypothetical protein